MDEAEVIVTFVSLVKDCDDAVSPLSDVIPLVPAPPVWSVAQDKVTIPPTGAEADNSCPALGAPDGNTYV